MNIAFLALFKYSDFIVSNLALATGQTFLRFPVGIPIAISFYTFHVISYLVDLRSGKVQALRFRDFLFYLLFFPHLIAGPIVRVWQLVPQIGVRKISKWDLIFGVHYLTLGYFLKAIAADNLGAGIDPFWSMSPPYFLFGAERWIVALLYYCQIYADFAGYSLMALGLARLLGYRLPPNFRLPMLATNLQNFWRRWHITLSQWLRDYLYISLGGSRATRIRTAVNLLITMLLGGLWHGAAWGFIVWGFMHGLGLVWSRFLSKRVLVLRPRLRLILLDFDASMGCARLGILPLSVCGIRGSLYRSNVSLFRKVFQHSRGARCIVCFCLNSNRASRWSAYVRSLKQKSVSLGDGIDHRDRVNS